jgi:hypothetical protein
LSACAAASRTDQGQGAEDTVVAVTGIRAYPAGFGFTLNLRLRSIAPPDPRMFWPFQISRTTVAASRPSMGSCV